MKRFLLLLGFTLILTSCVRSLRAEVMPTSRPIELPTATAQPDNPIDIAVVENAIQQAIDLEQTTTLAFIIAKTNIENIDISSDGMSAVGWLIPIDPDTDEPVPIEPGLVLLRKFDNDWRVWLPTTNGWVDTLLEVPDEILSPEHKKHWERRFQIQAANIPTEAFSGYKLPWEAGVTRRLTQSTCHDLWIPSGNAHFSFDFSTRGILWDIHAAKGGRMWLWKDTVPTCNEYTCSDHQPVGNYVVIRDETTDPVTYQLYLHLKQDSIPDELKVKGKLIGGGQFIGVVDNTGQSWGHHLHFQVQVPLYGDNYYWGRAIDITFDDVEINGGRPRVINAWCNDERYCDEPGDICTEFQEHYTSQNEIFVGSERKIFFPLIKHESNQTQTPSP